jgi:hypothetical protein
MRRAAIAGPPVIYLFMTLLMGLKSVGLQYDEALLQHGAVHMLNSTGEPPFVHDRGSWVLIGGRYWPLVVIPYIGAVKDYLLLLPFALFGPGAELARAVNALLGAFGIFGVGTLLRRDVGVGAAAATGFVLAIHPAYVDQTLYDNGTVAVWMALVGMIAVTVCGYKRYHSTAAAFAIGLGMGIGVWNRVNFAWFLGSALIGIAIAFRKRTLIPLRHLAALTLGAAVGVFPMLWFQDRSHWVILRFMEAGQTGKGVSQLLGRRAEWLAEILLSGSEQRSIWGGPPLPWWQPYFFSALVIFGLVVCIGFKRNGNESVVGWQRASALTLIIYVLSMFSSRLRIAQHHLITVVPVAAIVVSLAIQRLIALRRAAMALAVLIALVYGASALYWDAAAMRGIGRTEGVDMWSGAIYSVNQYLRTNHQGREISILDWGFQNNLYVLSDAKVKSRELFWGATREHAILGRSWTEAVLEGGVFLTGSGTNVHFPEASEGFLSALAASHRPYSVVEFRQKGGAGYAQLIEILPSPSKPGTR